MVWIELLSNLVRRTHWHCISEEIQNSCAYKYFEKTIVLDKIINIWYSQLVGHEKDTRRVCVQFYWHLNPGHDPSDRRRLFIVRTGPGLPRGQWRRPGHCNNSRDSPEGTGTRSEDATQSVIRDQRSHSVWEPEQGWTLGKLYNKADIRTYLEEEKQRCGLLVRSPNFLVNSTRGTCVSFVCLRQDTKILLQANISWNLLNNNHRAGRK